MLAGARRAWQPGERVAAVAHRRVADHALLLLGNRGGQPERGLRDLGRWCCLAGRRGRRRRAGRAYHALFWQLDLGQGQAGRCSLRHLEEQQDHHAVAAEHLHGWQDHRDKGWRVPVSSRRSWQGPVHRRSSDHGHPLYRRRRVSVQHARLSRPVECLSGLACQTDGEGLLRKCRAWLHQQGPHPAPRPGHAAAHGSGRGPAGAGRACQQRAARGPSARRGGLGDRSATAGLCHRAGHGAHGQTLEALGRPL
mmetsp:Transcript_89144/g.249110  ORF Transcript_89144/g.249110 Transcript_89144/m.249110 type:complete len:252 (+) Transcript_89144:172-927(+)